MKSPILEPGEHGFDEAIALWNTRLVRRPDQVVRPVDGEDVAAALRYARENDLELSVKGGGHSYAANTVAASGLLIDLSRVDEVTVDVDERTARVGGGAVCAQLDAATQAHGLATPTPTVSSIGVAGAALGGGSGYLSRKYGLLTDNVTSWDVVTAEGQRVTASARENPDLFWALRGGGGNFGVVTAVEVNLHEIGPTVLAGQIVYPFDDATAMLRFFCDFMEDAPEELQCYPFIFRVPPIDLFPAETHGSPVLDFVFCHQNPEAVDDVQPLRELGEPILEFVAPTPYTEAQTAFDANLPKGHRYYSKAHHLPAISDGAIDTVVRHVPAMEGEFTACYFEPLGGAIGRVGVPETPYGGREAPYGFHLLSGWVDPADDRSGMDWAARFHGEMAEHATGGVYVNLIADDEAERVRSAYGPNYDRLAALKAEWDPDNVFHNNYNVPPA